MKLTLQLLLLSKMLTRKKFLDNLLKFSLHTI